MKKAFYQVSPFQAHFFCLMIIFTLVLLMFADVIFTSKDVVLSIPQGDMANQFIPWREFGFGQLRKGNLALWNPHIFSGMPYFGEFQSALLYPLNFVFLFLPIAKAINLNIALHVFLIGVFMYLWAVFRGLHPAASLVSAALVMFCGPYFLFVFAGNLPNICTIAWIPLVFLSVDGLFEKRSLGFCLLGILAVSMMIFAGHIQYVFYTAVALFFYSGIRMLSCAKRGEVSFGLLSIAIGAFGITAVQLLSGLQAASESVRGSGLSFSFASMFSFPFENMVTLFAPRVFGDDIGFAYWGRCYAWEMTFFIGVAGIMLALSGIIYSSFKGRRLLSIMVIGMFVLALGAHAPLFKPLFRWIPGFNLFRGTSKFIFFSAMFLALLAGAGFDQILNSRRIRGSQLILPLAFGAVLFTFAFYMRHFAIKDSLGSWQSFLSGISASKESYLPSLYYTNQAFVQKAAVFASKDLMASSGVCLFLFLVFLLLNISKKKYAVFCIAGFAIVEIFFFAKVSRISFSLSSLVPKELKNFTQGHPGDYRVLNLFNPNLGMILGLYDIWGYDPGVSKRYAEFIAFTQGKSPENANNYVSFSRNHPLFRMLGCKYILLNDKGGIKLVQNENILPSLFLIREWELIEKRNEILGAMDGPHFDPSRKVFFETDPGFAPQSREGQWEVDILDSSTDHLTLHVQLQAPAVLVIGNNYSSGWRVVPLKKSAQKKYSIFPANYIFQGIPLSLGEHLFKVEYLPRAFVVGKYLSIVSLFFYLLICALYFRSKFQKKHSIQ